MIKIRKSENRGQSKLDWLDSRHTFSFDQYRDPEFTHFSDLRVINEDWIEPSSGFGEHPHHDMEIVTYVLSGQLEHRDSMGNGSTIRAGDVQKMSAGMGVLHSEFNPSRSTQVHLFQIWIFPSRKGIHPSYEQKPFSTEQKTNRLALIASADGEGDSVALNQDVKVFASILESGKSLEYAVSENRSIWIQMAKGKLTLSGITLEPGDGAAITQESLLKISSSETAEFLLFDLR